MLKKINMEIKFMIGQTVFLRTDSEQRERIVTGVTILPGMIRYGLSCGTEETWHYEFEINENKDVIKAM
ncbi:MAG: hypothetical protein ACLFQX_04090 [Candidatus Kapaibacterium sp.]